MSYDPRCHDLAELFLGDEPALKGREAELAQLIQTTIEDFITYERGCTVCGNQERRESGLLTCECPA